MSDTSIIALCNLGIAIVSLISIIVSHYLRQQQGLKHTIEITTGVEKVKAAAEQAYKEANDINKKIAAVGAAKLANGNKQAR